MSYGSFGSNTNLFTDGASGSTLTRQFDVLQSVGNIMAFPFLANTTDLSGNHTIDSGTPTLQNTVGSTQYTYDGNDMIRINTTATEAPRIIASTQAHQIPRVNPVTFGFFCMANGWGGSTPQFMVSGSGGGASNYGLQRQTNAGWRAQGSGGTTSTLGDQRDITQANRWFHVALAIEGNRDSSSAAEFYINGTAVWTGSVSAGGSPSVTDNFSFGSDSDESTAKWTGFMGNCFVADSVLSPATIKALSDESFGHASPYAAPSP